MDSWHPLVVHFPLVLLPLAVGLDLLALARRDTRWQGLAYGILWLGVVSSAAAVLSGNAAADPHRSDLRVQALVAAHEDRATWTLLLFLGLALGRLPLQLQGRLQGGRFKVWLALAAAGCILLWLTGYTGGELVYRYGVGVKTNP